MFKLLSLLTLCAATTSFLPHQSSSAPSIEVVGPSVLLNARDAGRVNIVDLRTSGRAVPDARRDYQSNGAPLFVLADEETARDWLDKHRINQAMIIPPRFIEYHDMPGVPQIAPRAAQQKVDEGWPLFDISEQFEWENSRLPRSRRLDYARFRGGDWSELPHDKPFIVACRVGHRSQLVVRELRARGYDARNLDGGLWQWECDGLKVTR